MGAGEKVSYHLQLYYLLRSNPHTSVNEVNKTTNVIFQSSQDKTGGSKRIYRSCFPALPAASAAAAALRVAQSASVTVVPNNTDDSAVVIPLSSPAAETSVSFYGFVW